jgi:hypothetical protein
MHTINLKSLNSQRLRNITLGIIMNKNDLNRLVWNHSTTTLAQILRINFKILMIFLKLSIQDSRIILQIETTTTIKWTLLLLLNSYQIRRTQSNLKKLSQREINLLIKGKTLWDKKTAISKDMAVWILKTTTSLSLLQRIQLEWQTLIPKHWSSLEQNQKSTRKKSKAEEEVKR